MSSCLPSTQPKLHTLPVQGRKGVDAVQSLHGNALHAVTPNPVVNPKRTPNAHVIIKVHEVGAP